jgi:DNA-binding MarR family transcriptional regulator
MSNPADQTNDRNISAVRGFNRFYTRQIGVLHEGLLQSPFSLTEARVLYEVANRPKSTATGLCQDLGLDPGYLSRILSEFARQGLIRRSASPSDRRQSHLALTTKGKKTFAALDVRQREEIAALLRPISSDGQSQLVKAMHSIESLLGTSANSKTAYLLRSHQPAAWVSASVSLKSAFDLPARRATKKLSCGRKANCRPPGISTKKLDLNSSKKNLTVVGDALTWCRRFGN